MPTSTEASLRGRIGALALHASHDSKELTKNARAAFRSKFEREVDPNGELPEEERLRRAEMKRREFYARMAHASWKARQRRGRGAA
jgi:hypothetical protein